VIASVGDGDVEHLHGPFIPAIHRMRMRFFPYAKGDQRAYDEGDERPQALLVRFTGHDLAPRPKLAMLWK